MSDYFTHQQYLSKELSSLNNNSIVLELGIGERRGQNYSKEFTFEDNYEILPPTLTMRKIKK